jgi:hypothetical protein
MLFSKQTPAAGGDAFAQFDAAWCYNGNGYIFNDTGTSLDVRIGDSGSVQTVAAGKTLPIALVFSMAELYVRRTDQSPTQVTVEATVGLNAGAADGGGGGTSGPVAAADITDAGTAGIAVLQAVTPAQVRAAAGFGGTVTVAALNAAGADARSAMYYCSDCLTVNGPGSLVAWCGRTLSWRTMDDCLLATTSFTAWVSDFVANSNSGELRGTNGALFRVFETAPGGGFTGVNSATSQITVNRPMLYRRLITGTNANGYVRALGTTVATVGVTGVRAFSSLNSFIPNTTAGVTMRVGLSGIVTPTNALHSLEYSLCMDKGNVLGGLNSSLSVNYLGCIRESSVNLSGSGDTSIAVSTEATADLLVVCDLDAVKLIVGGVEAATGVRTAPSPLYPFAVWSSDGTSTTSATADIRNFCCGYLLP